MGLRQRDDLQISISSYDDDQTDLHSEAKLWRSTRKKSEKLIHKVVWLI